MDWDAVIEGSEVIVEKILPPLEGVASLLDQPKKSAPQQAPVATSPVMGLVASSKIIIEEEPFRSGAGFKLLLLFFGSVVLAGTLFVLRKPQR
jgi:hypothetical protein